MPAFARASAGLILGFGAGGGAALDAGGGGAGGGRASPPVGASDGAPVGVAVGSQDVLDLDFLDGLGLGARSSADADGRPAAGASPSPTGRQRSVDDADDLFSLGSIADGFVDDTGYFEVGHMT